MSNNVINLSTNNFKNICRTCLSEGKLLPLYENCTENTCLVEMLMSCTFVQFQENDGLPNQICEKCVNEIKRAYKFAKQCEIADRTIRTNLTNQLKNRKNIWSLKNKIDNVICSSTEPDLKLEPKIKFEIDESESPKSQKIEFINVKDESENNFNQNQSSDFVQNSEDADEQYSSDQSTNDIYKNVNSKVKRKRNNKVVPPFTCKLCDIAFESAEDLQEHRTKVKHPRPRTHSCPICQKQFTSWSLKAHMRTHTKERPFLCSVCGKGFSLNRNLRRHVMIHTGERPYKCHLCEKAFIQLNTLKDHLRVHSGERPFICNVCGVRYKQQAQLKLHLKVHTDSQGERKKRKKRVQRTDVEPEHECPICHKRYHTKPVLKQHMVVHGEKTFLCSDCGKGFYSKATLQAHSKVHTGIKPYSCEVCGKSFSHYGTLASHNLIHTGEKPFSCSVCNKAFTQRNHVKYHMRTHTGERPYSCSVCGKTFSLNGTLTVHMRTHTGETPYLCPICGKGFHDSSSMKKHKRGHGEQTA